MSAELGCGQAVHRQNDEKDEYGDANDYLGVWVKSKSRIKTGVGEAIADRQRVDAPALDNPNVADTPEVEFDVSASVVDIDLDRPIRERRAGSRGGRGVGSGEFGS